uniref:Glomulin, FKBP associated protein b n=1 Tax=Cyprinus carpio TaxID=7962 RepID=A0A8C2PUH7_CYPCA
MVANQLENLVQRWRTTEDFVPEDHELFLNAGHTCIAQGDYTQLLDFIKEEANQHIVRSMGSGLLPALVNEVLRKDRNPANCQAILNQLVQICSVKELLDILLQQVEEDTDPNAINLKTAKATILIMSESEAHGLALALDSLQKKISKLPVPYSHKQEQEDVYRLCRCCTAVLTFVQPFVQEVKNQDTYSVATKLRAALLKLYSLREPLQLDREVNMTEISPLWNFATEIMAILAVIQQSLPKILFYRPLRGKEDTISEKDAFHLNESRACMAYLLFVQLITIQVFPASDFPSCFLSPYRKYESWIFKGLVEVMESLNLLRYLLIQERKFSNVIWTDLCHIADSYTKLLRLCLSMSKSYYGTELKRHREDKKIKTKEFKEASRKRSVQSLLVKALGNMPCEVLQCALVTYDLMESLVVHIEEINEDSQK